MSTASSPSARSMRARSKTRSTHRSSTGPQLKASIFREAARLLGEDSDIMFSCNALFYARHPEMYATDWSDDEGKYQMWKNREEKDIYCVAFARMLKPNVQRSSWYILNGEEDDSMLETARIIGLLLCAEILEDEGSLPVQPHMVSSS